MGNTHHRACCCGEIWYRRAGAKSCPCHAKRRSNYELSEWCIERMYWRELAKASPAHCDIDMLFRGPQFLSDGERLPRLLDVDNMLLSPRRATTTSTEGGVQGRRVVRNVSNNLLGEDTSTSRHNNSPGTSPTIKQVYDRLSCVRLIKNNDCSVPRCVIT